MFYFENPTAFSKILGKSFCVYEIAFDITTYKPTNQCNQPFPDSLRVNNT